MSLGIGTAAGPGLRAKALILEGWIPCHVRMDLPPQSCSLLVLRLRAMVVMPGLPQWVLSGCRLFHVVAFWLTFGD